MRPFTRPSARGMLRAALAALPLAVVALAACFEGDVPTRQIGGTEYGLLLTVPSPLRLPGGSFTARAFPNNLTLDSLIVTLSSLKPLVGKAAYRFYAVGGGVGDTVPVAARLTAIRVDSSVTAAGSVSTTTDSSEIGTSTFFHGAGPNTTVRARFGGAQFGGITRRYLVVTIQADSTAPAFTATTPQPVWVQYRNLAVPPPPPPVIVANSIITGGNTIFGNFNVNAPRPFIAIGRGRSAFWDRSRDMRLVYSAIVEDIAQPPLGYFYQPWLRDTRTRRGVPFGELRDAAGASLHDAYLLVIPGSVAQIPAARFDTNEDSVGTALQTFDGVHLVIEPKLGQPGLSLASVLVGTFGDTLASRGFGSIEVTAVRGQELVPGVQIVVRAVSGNNAVGQPIPATTVGDEPLPALKGKITITKIPAGEVELIVTPPSGFTATASPLRVTVLRGQTTPVTIALQ